MGMFHHLNQRLSGWRLRYPLFADQPPSIQSSNGYQPIERLSGFGRRQPISDNFAFREDPLNGRKTELLVEQNIGYRRAPFLD
jgi:hypothetical protein